MKNNNNLIEVRKIIESSLKVGDSYINDGFNYLISTSGKMIRPNLVLIGASFSKKSESKIKDINKIAAAIEILHTASLLHDDIIDESKIRRGKESIQSKYSKEYALYMGDFLMSECFSLLNNVVNNKDIAVLISKLVKRMCIGEMKQFKNRFNLDITIFEYLRIISNKTAFMFATSLSCVPLNFKENKDITRMLYRTGYYLGMEFQIIDDIFDYSNETLDIGKDINKDLISGQFNLPLIYSLQSKNSKQIKEEFKDNGENNMKNIYRLVKESNSIEKSRLLAEKYHKKAMTNIEKLKNERLLEFAVELNKRIF